MGGKETKAIKQQSIQEWTLNLNWSEQKRKTKNLLGCFEINSIFRTSVHGFFFRLVTRLKHGLSYRSKIV